MLRRFTSERIRKARRKRLTLSVSLGVILVVSSFFLLVQLVNLPELAIDHVSLSGNRAVSSQEILALVEPELDGFYWHMFSKRNAFLFPRDVIEQAIAESFVKIKTVRVERDGLRTLSIDVVERQSAALWCATTGTRSCYFVDDTGIAFAVAPRLSGSSFISYEKDLPLNPLGQQLTDEAHFRELQNVMTFMMTLGLKPLRVSWKEGLLDVSVIAKTSNGDIATHIYIPLVGPYDSSLTNLASILEGFDFVGVEYIDVRFENKVFYKEGEARSYELEGEDI